MADGKNIEKLNLENIGRYFESKGYKVINLNQPWRHVVGELLLENEKLFLKLAVTSELSNKTLNEKAWNEIFNSHWYKNCPSFISPRVVDCGEYEGRYWYVSEFIFGKQLASMTKRGTDISKTDIEMSARIAHEITSLSEYCLLPNDNLHLRSNVSLRMLKNSTLWSRASKSNTSRLLQYIKQGSDGINIGVVHGDFTPWSIIKTSNKRYCLVDSEHSQVVGLKHYDAAYYYHRLYTKYLRPDLAELFLEKYKLLQEFSEDKLSEFKTVLGFRVMGGYYDADRDGVTDVGLSRQLEKQLYK